MNSLREWWSLPVDYGWNVAYARSQQALHITKVLIGIWCWLFGAAAAVGLATPGLGEGGLGSTALWFSVVTAAPVGLAWTLGGWPTWHMSIAFVLYADVVLAAVVLSIGMATTILPLAALFTVIGSYVAGFHGPKLLTAHNVFALFTTGVLYGVAVVTEPELGLESTLYLVMLVLVMFSAPLIVHTFLMLLRRDATAAFYDPLTGMQNRRGFDASIGNLRLRSGPESTVTAVVIDLDNFKSVNDRFGHQHGDTVIRLTASRILDIFPAPDITARLGGEEFAIVSVAGLDSVTARAEELRIRLCEANNRSSLTASMGVDHAVVDPRDVAAEIEALLSSADRAMYRAKRLGGDRVVTREDGQLPAREVDEQL
ncbi:Diguanylate cyclase [Rhodococcus sp. AW25M09]|uniref:GGDEF domain-containing protein n=1 Tax=Rhodococcus sp. AW25M09 TaxID=1268303 RepID=UPI0002ACAD4E|nr:GGDEF domain-containing protein [Rhodococcus sp. AW25M09]CCQ13571.1 Diguanylate cyclase [Rhodococcus sp. AW25M09]